MISPRPKGTVVYAETPNGVHLSGLLHPYHPFLIVSEAKEAENNSGWVQDVRCLVCGSLFRRVDAEFLRHRLDKSDLEDVLKLVDYEMDRLKSAKRRLEALL